MQYCIPMMLNRTVFQAQRKINWRRW